MITWNKKVEDVKYMKVHVWIFIVILFVCQSQNFFCTFGQKANLELKQEEK